MTKEEITLHNEHLAMQNVQREHKQNGIISAIRLCQMYTGLSVHAAYETVQDWTGGAE